MGNNTVSTSGRADQLIIGNIIANDGKGIVYEALTVKNGLVQYVGSLATAKKLCDDNTKIMDYKGNYIYPGFIDAHSHGLLAGPRLAFFADLADGNNYDEYFEKLKKYISEHPDNECYYGSGWEQYEELPTAGMLDDICADKPIALQSADGHSLWFNTKGMEKFGIDKSSVEKWGTDIIRVDESGNPSGYISEGPVFDISKQMNTFATEELQKAILIWQDFAFSRGITAYYEAGGSEGMMKFITPLVEQGKWKLRVYTGIMINETDDDYVKDVREAKRIADKYNNEYTQVTGVKLFMDGVIEGHTAWMLDEYTDKPGYFGVKRCCDFDRTVELYKEAAKLGLSVHQHTIGDAAVSFALDCIEKATLETGNMDMRNAMAHIQYVTEKDKKRMGDLNVIGVAAPLWATGEYTYCAYSIHYVGEERTAKSYPMKSLKDKGVTLAFHSDYPVSTAMSFPETVYMACNRRRSVDDENCILGVGEELSRQDALDAMTTGPAYSVKMENHLGRLIPGFVANMDVYDSDFLNDDFRKVAKSKLIATIVDGEEVYSGK